MLLVFVDKLGELVFCELELLRELGLLLKELFVVCLNVLEVFSE